MTIQFPNPHSFTGPLARTAAPTAQTAVTPAAPVASPAAGEPAAADDAARLNLPANAERALPWGTQAVAEGIFAGQANQAQAGSGSGIQTKADVAAFFSEQGIPAEESAKTLAYLDRVGADYAEIGTLISNQLSFKRDGNDVLGAVQAYGVVLEAKKLGVAGTDSAHFNEVATGLREGRVYVDRDTTRTDMSNSAARYRFEADTIFLPPGFDINSTYRRSVLFHELVHTRQDVTHGEQRMADKPLFQEAEVEAYKAQGDFLHRNGVRPETGEIKGHLAINPAIKHAQWARYEQSEAGKNPPNAGNIRKAQQQQAAFAEEIDDVVRKHYQQAHLTLTADGLHTHHH